MLGLKKGAAMLNKKSLTALFAIVSSLAVLAVVSQSALAAPPVVKTVPWVASNPLIPHDTWSGKSVRLKGTSDQQGANFIYTWDFGDGSPVATGAVTNKYVIEATHAYTGATGTVYTATLTVQDTSIPAPNTGSAKYYVIMQNKSLPVEVNLAIDEGLWYLHKTQIRSTSGGIDYGSWTTCSSFGCNAALVYYGVGAANINAFEVNGHLEGGSAGNPYTETVARGMRWLFTVLAPGSISMQTYPAPTGTVNPDSNGNGIGVWLNQSYYPYQTGMFMDAIVASGTPTALTTTGPVNVIGRMYKDIVQDMVDGYAYGQYNGADNARGGWRYNWNDYPDNSACQWAAIGIIAAEREWGTAKLGAGGIVVPAWVKTENRDHWIPDSWVSSDGGFTYQNGYPYPWGPYATTPSALVQMAMDGVGRGSVFGLPTARQYWDSGETFIRNRFCNSGGSTGAIRNYYYGLFSFTKAMLLHDSNNDGIAEPITLLQSSTAGVQPIDWYAAEASAGAQCDGVARTLVNTQSASDGSWYGHDYEGNQYRFETAWAIIMLNKTVFASGVPVAVAQATPNPAVGGQTITLSGSDSFHQDPAKAIDSWEWDFDNDGTFDATGPTATYSWPAIGDYPVKLRVSDNGTPESTAEAIITVRITTPPIAPTANAGGPYAFCLNRTPFYLDGRGSINPDDGQSEPGQPGDFIKAYQWDLDGDGAFDDASGATPDVTSFFATPGSHLIQLKVTDNTASSFPSSGYGDLSDTDSSQVAVKAADDPACACVSNLAARAKLTKIQLTWTHIPVSGWHHYNIYRGTVSGGPYLKIGETTSTYSTFLDSGPLTVDTMYYYVVREAELNGDELCQSNQASARPTRR